MSNMLYLLGGASILSVFIVTIINALAYGAAQSFSSSRRTTELVPISLSVVSCVALIMLSFLVHKDIRHNHQWPRWKVGVFLLTVAYFLIAAGSTAGTMATNHSQLSLFIVQSVFWGISVFAQGSYCGYLLVICFHQKSDSWPRSYHLSQELKALPDTPTSVTPPVQALCDPYPEMKQFDTRRSSLRKFPRRSNRDSGLCLESVKHGSFDTTSTTSTLSPTEQSFHTHRTLRNGSIRSMPSLRQDPRQLSLDTLVQPSPTASTFHIDSPTGSMETLTIQEHNIHPLFRSTSPCPSPTPTPGTRVKASPSAGQTITHQTLTRMRSARSLRERQIPSPFLSAEELAHARKDPESGLSFIDAGHVRRSITQYEKKYDLNESPDEN